MERVRPGVELVLATLAPSRELMTLDFPTLERPRKATSGTEAAGKWASAEAASRNRETTFMPPVCGFRARVATGVSTTHATKIPRDPHEGFSFLAVNQAAGRSGGLGCAQRVQAAQRAVHDVVHIGAGAHVTGAGCQRRSPHLFVSAAMRAHDAGAAEGLVQIFEIGQADKLQVHDRHLGIGVGDGVAQLFQRARHRHGTEVAIERCGEMFCVLGIQLGYDNVQGSHGKAFPLGVRGLASCQYRAVAVLRFRTAGMLLLNVFTSSGRSPGPGWTRTARAEASRSVSTESLLFPPPSPIPCGRKRKVLCPPRTAPAPFPGEAPPSPAHLRSFPGAGGTLQILASFTPFLL